MLPAAMLPPKDTAQIESRTLAIGQEIFAQSRMSWFGKNYWYQKLMELATSNPRVKTQLFRFVDVLPVLQTEEQKREHLLEYLGKPAAAVHWPFLLSALSSGINLPAVDSLLIKFAEKQIRAMAENFIVGHTLEEALPKLLTSRRKKLAFTVDLLGEAVVSEEEASAYIKKYKNLISGLGRAAKGWTRDAQMDQSALGPIPPVNISLKISALDCRMDPIAFEKSLERLIQRIEPLLEVAVENEVFINFDMEQDSLGELTRELFKRLISLPKFKNYRHFGIVLQAYLRKSLTYAYDWIEFARERGTPFSIRLVKGAYWDYEVIVANQNGWEPPVFMRKEETDANYEDCTRTLLSAYPHIELAIGSHNVRSISHALAYAENLRLPTNALEFQMLYGMADSFKTALTNRGLRLREYDPVGEMIPGLSYLVRRLLENSANDSFLKQSFMDGTEVGLLLRKPLASAGEIKE